MDYILYLGLFVMVAVIGSIVTIYYFNILKNDSDKNSKTMVGVIFSVLIGAIISGGLFAINQIQVNTAVEAKVSKNSEKIKALEAEVKLLNAAVYDDNTNPYHKYNSKDVSYHIGIKNEELSRLRTENMLINSGKFNYVNGEVIPRGMVIITK